MPHQRQLIRDAVVTALTDSTAAGANVEASRQVSLRTDTLPFIAVYTPSETADDQSTAPRELQRTLQVVVQGHVRATTGTTVAVAMDDLSLEIETAMHADRFFAGVALDSTLTGTELELGEEGDRETGICRLTYQFDYSTLAPDAPTLDAFQDVDATYNLDNSIHPDDQAQDVFTVEE